MPPKKKVSRSAKTGEFVSQEQAEASPDTTVTETIESPEAQVLSIVKDHEGEESLQDVLPAPEFHPILLVWREILAPARQEGGKRVTAQWASRMVNTYAGLAYSDMNWFRDKYYERVDVLFQILLDEIAADEDCLTYGTAEEDVEENSYHYKNLLLQWQLQFLQWELEWECDSENAAADLASISEIHKMFFSDKGITAFLDQIRFEYTESDQAELSTALNDLKEASGE